MLNIGIEGTMLVGRLRRLRRGVPQRLHHRSGFLAGAGAGAAVSVIMVVLCVWSGLDQIVVGIAITLVGEGATALIFDAQFAESRPTLGDTGRVSIPLLSDIPVVGGRDSSDGSVFSQPAIVYIGPDPGRRGGLDDAADPHGAQRAGGRRQAGRARRRRGQRAGHPQLGRPLRRAPWRAWAVPTCRSRPPGSSRTSSPGGAGFIAIVLAMLARGKALWVLIGSFIFGISLSLSDALQIAGVDISTDVVFMLPFVAVIVVLVIFGRRSYLPPALGLPYVRGAR